jgi:hypothetical protein
MSTAQLGRRTGTGVETANDSIIILDVERTIRGGRTLDVSTWNTDVIPGGHVIISETATGDYKPMPITSEPGGVLTVDTLVAGTGYTNGTYENVPLAGGSGTGALATVVVALTVVSSVTITSAGKDYVVDDTLTVPGVAYAGGTETTTASVDVATISAGVYAALPSGHTYKGILISTIPKTLPLAGIMTHGGVNPVPMKYAIASILSAFKTATENRIHFASDSE